MNVCFVNRVYWPNEAATAQLLTDLAEYLADAGATVSILTSRTDANAPMRETKNGVSIVRVGSAGVRSNQLSGRALDYARFHLAVREHLRRPDFSAEIVVALSDPPMLGNSVTTALRQRSAGIVHWVHDIYPDVVEAVRPNPLTRMLARMLRPSRNRAWQAASACVTLGSAMAQRVAAAGVEPSRIHCIENWAPRGLEAPSAEAVTALRDRWGLKGKFVVGYSGNLGRVHDLEGLVRAAHLLRNDSRIAFVFVGGGPGLRRIQQDVEQARLAQVQFRPPQPRAELAVALAAADLHIVAVRPGCEHVVFPSKLYGSTAVERGILFLGERDSDVARVVATHRLGAALPAHDAEGIARFLRTIAAAPEQITALGNAAKRFHEERGGWLRGCESWRRLLESVAAPRQSGINVGLSS